MSQLTYSQQEYQSLCEFAYADYVNRSRGLGTYAFAPVVEVLMARGDMVLVPNLNRTIKKRFKNKRFETRECFNALFVTPYEDLPLLISHPDPSVGMIAAWRIKNGK